MADNSISENSTETAIIEGDSAPAEYGKFGNNESSTEPELEDEQSDSGSVEDQSESSGLVKVWSEPKLVSNWSEPALVDDWSKYSPKDTGETPEEQAAKIAEIDFEQFYGSWKLWIPGGMTNLYYKDTGNFATGVYNPGAGAGTLEIKKNGTYILDHIVWGNGKVKGEWRLPEPGEIKHDQAIILPDGPHDTDWAVAVSEDGKLNLYSKSITNDVVYWFFDTNMSEE